MKDKGSNIIRVNFRKGNLSIDDDSYLSRVTKIHCRACLKQKNRNGARELFFTWGYVCADCQDNAIASERFKSDKVTVDKETRDTNQSIILNKKLIRLRD